MYNLYALARNSWKYVDRDKRKEKIQHIEYDFLAPDTVNEIFTAMSLMEAAVGKAYARSGRMEKSFSDDAAAGRYLLQSGNKVVNELEILAENAENSKRKVVLIKVLSAYKIYEELVVYYGTISLLTFIRENDIDSLDVLKAAIHAKKSRGNWVNVGGQLLPEEEINLLKEKIKNGKIKSWDAVHDYYTAQGEKYPQLKLKHALTSLSEITGINLKRLDNHQFSNLLNQAIATKEWLTKGIYDARAKDYTNPYRKMVYESIGEMNEVLGKLEENSFIKQQIEELKQFKTGITALKKKFKLKS